VLQKLSQHVYDNYIGIWTLEMIVVISCVILGITIVMVIKQEFFPKLGRNKEPAKVETPPARY
jgi:hypothetical protein